MIHYTLKSMFSAIPALQYIILNRTEKSKPANFTVITILNIQIKAEVTVVADEEQVKSKRPSRAELFRLSFSREFCSFTLLTVRCQKLVKRISSWKVAHNNTSNTTYWLWFAVIKHIEVKSPRFRFGQQRNSWSTQCEVVRFSKATSRLYFSLLFYFNIFCVIICLWLVTHCCVATEFNEFLSQSFY